MIGNTGRWFVGGFVALAMMAEPAAAQDTGWPREFMRDGARLTYYQPQVDAWTDQRVLESRVAITLTPPGDTVPLAGSLWVRATTTTHLERREVVLENIEVVRSKFSIVDDQKRARVEAAVKALVPKGPLTVSLDRILANLRNQAVPTAEVAVRNDPPRILVSTQPARLVVLDGEPTFVDIDGSDLGYAVNTNWPLFRERATGRHFLLDDKTWLVSPEINGPWSLAATLPPGFARLPQTDNWADARAALPVRAVPGARAPAIHLTTVPAELVVIDGAPRLADIAGTRLQLVANTQSDLFFQRDQRRYYLLIAGRWFRAASLDGPWAFATRDLPPDFARIPATHPKARVLASVPGTPQAKEAIRIAAIPVTATVSRSTARLTVTYGGAPVFRPIAGTPLHYAVNASTTVLKLADASYLACDKGVWFTAESATGPWHVADAVPPVVYTIPPSSPVHNVTYVRIESATPSQVVTGYTAGYLYAYPSADVLVWGTGYAYPAYWSVGAAPVYYPAPYTWGAATYYNPATSAYARGGYAYGPYGGAGAGAVYNPATGVYGRGVAAYGPNAGGRAGSTYNTSTGAWTQSAAAYGPNGTWRGGQAYNPQTGVYAAGSQTTNAAGSSGQGTVSRGDASAEGRYTSGARGTASTVQTSQGTGYARMDSSRGGATTVAQGQNNTYVGHDGNVYRRTDSGWQKYDDGSWSSAGQPAQASRSPAAAQRPAEGAAPAAGQGRFAQALGRGGVDSTGGLVRPMQADVRQGLDRDAQARAFGEQQHQRFRGGAGGGGLDRPGHGGFGGRR